jgi:Ca2+-binding RTX toxin-like protein
MPRRVTALAAVAAFALLPATAAQAVDATYSNFAYPTTPAPGATAIITPPADTSRALNVTITADQPCFFGCGAKEYIADGTPGINKQTSRCTQSTATDPINCSAEATLPSLTTITGTGLNDTVANDCFFLFSGYNPPVTITGLGGDDKLTGSCGSDTIDGGDGNDTIDGNFSGTDTLHGGAGRDTITGTLAADTITGDDGRDAITALAGADNIDGGADNDRIDAGDDNDTINGGLGGDFIIPGAGTDSVTGGAGRDTVSYEDHDGSQPVTIALNGQAVSGAAGENDTIATDVEDAVGTPGPDTITGNGDANAIDAGDGADAIDGGAGPDLIDAGPGNDTIFALDGVPDIVDCGDGDDTVTKADQFDTLQNCEHATTSRELQSDVDNDGIPAPADCNDQNAAIRPGLPDKPGDGIDQDCSGSDAPYSRVLSSLSYKFNATSTTKYTSFSIVDVLPNTTVEFRCSGKKCPLKGVKTVKGKSVPASTLNVLKPLKKLKFKPKQVLEVRVLAPDMIGKVVQYTFAKNSGPTSKVLCLSPKAGSKPGKCT